VVVVVEGVQEVVVVVDHITTQTFEIILKNNNKNLN
jgi:hypothetical protein